MTGLKSLLLAAAVAAAGTSAASAEIVVEGVHWQAGRVERGRVVAWTDVRVLQDGPPKLDNRLRARLVLKNRGPKPEEGLLIRYSLSARVAPSGGAVADGAWTVPFAVDEKRVPLVGPNKVVEVVLDPKLALDAWARRLSRTGWWPDRLKIQVMLEPHPGDKALQTVEDVLEITAEAAK